MIELYFKEGYLSAYDNLQLFYWRLQPQATRAVLCILHGAGEHCSRYINFGKYFFERSFAVYAVDFRGHGRSQGKRGDVTKYEEYLFDIDKIVQLARRELNGKKLFLIGHSLGGLTAALYALKYQESLSGVILLSPALNITIEVPAIKKTLGKLLYDVFPSLTMDNEIDPYLLSHDYTTIREYKEDKLVHYKVSLRLYREARIAMVNARRSAKNLRLPLLVMHGGDDKLVSPKASEHFVERAGSSDKQFKLYEGYYHELHHEVGKDKVYRDIENWLSARAAQV